MKFQTLLGLLMLKFWDFSPFFCFLFFNLAELLWPKLFPFFPYFGQSSFFSLSYFGQSPSFFLLRPKHFFLLTSAELLRPKCDKLQSAQRAAVLVRLNTQLKSSLTPSQGKLNINFSSLFLNQISKLNHFKTLHLTDTLCLSQQVSRPSWSNSGKSTLVTPSGLLKEKLILLFLGEKRRRTCWNQIISHLFLFVYCFI